MNEIKNIVIGKSAVPSLIISIILMIAIPVIFFIYWRKNYKQQTKISWLIAGAAGFIVSARVLELGVHMVCIVLDNPVSRFINGNTAAYVLYGTVMAGVFEECGRYVILKYIMKKNRSPENAVLYGIGHGGIEVFTVAVPMIISYLAIAVLFSAGDTESALSALNITEETAAAALPTVQAAAAFGCGMTALNAFERLWAMLAHIGFTVIVYYGAVNAKKAYLPMAIILHMLADTLPALYQKGLVPLFAVELWGAVWAGIVVFIAVKLYRKMKASNSAEAVS